MSAPINETSPADANERLIAAAPELYKTLLLIRTFIVDDDLPAALVKKIDAALAKAAQS